MPNPANPSSSAQPRLRVVDRNQFVLRAMDIEQFIAQDHPARALWEFVGRLDLSKFYEPMKAVEGHPGQPGNDPQLMIALWLYAYSRGIGSAREIERQCEYEPGFQWLCALKPINHHSLSDFRVDYDKPLTELFTQVLGVLSAEGLITLERVTHDGTRIRAAASGNTFRSEKTLREHLEQARQQVRAMGDPSQPPANDRKAAAQRRAKQEREQRLESALEQLQQLRQDRRYNQNEARASETDPEARVMKRSGGGFEPSYNLQISTDAAAGVIIGLNVTQSGADAPHLQPAIQRLKQTFGKVPDQVLADAGCISSQNIVALHEETDLLGPIPAASPARLQAQRKRYGVAEQFAADRFVFLAEQNSLQCPAGQLLPYYRIQDAPGGAVREYKATPDVCGACQYKLQCCPQTAARTIRVLDEDPEIICFRTKMEKPENIAIYKQRSQVAEFTNAWLKEKIGLRRFRVRGLRKVTLEALWAAITYNVQQWIRLRWRKQATTSA
jgi:transposase